MSQSSGEPPSRKPQPDILRWDEIPTTRWTLVGRAGNPAASTQAKGNPPTALEELLRLYLPVLRGHLTHTLRLPADRADDLLQGFLTDRIVERNLIGQADRTRGRFRRFLLTALTRYTTDIIRRERAAKRRPEPGPPVPMDDVAELAAPGPSAAERFDRMWANEVLGEVMRRTRATCHANGRPDCWTALEARILEPVTSGVAPIPHAELATRLGLPDASHASNLLSAGKSIFTRVFRQVVGEYVSIPAGADPAGAEAGAAIEEEIRDIWIIFARR